LKKDWVKSAMVLAPVIGLMLGASYYLWRDYNEPKVEAQSQTKQEAIGELSFSNNNVKRKSSESMYWNAAEKGNTLYNQDSIRTGADSYAIVKFKDASIIELNENSLIVLEKSSEQLNVNFKTGDISAKGASGNLAIKVKDSTVQAKDAEVKLKTDGSNQTQIQVKKGKAKLIDAQGKNVDLTSEKLAQIDETGRAMARRRLVLLNSPEDNTTLLDPTAKVKVPFTWTTLEKGLKEEILQVSSSIKFEKEKTQQKGAHQGTTFLLNQGRYFWRVGWKNKLGKMQFTEFRNLQIKLDRSVQLINPLQGANFEFAPGEDIVDFSWSADGKPRLYVFEIATDGGFKTILKSQPTKLKSFKLSGIKSGSYFWRVKAFDENNQEIGKSPTYRFSVAKVLPQLPLLIAPENGFQWTLADPLNFEWQPNPSAKQYKWLITRDPMQKQVVKAQTTAKTSYLWKWSKPGTYYWRVSSVDQTGQIIGQSLMYRVVVSPTAFGSAITLITPKNQATVERERRDPMDPVVFQWRPEMPLAGTYDFLISQNPNFEKALTKKGIDGNRLPVKLNKPANYYWKVRWTNPKDAKQVYHSSTYVMKFRVSANLPPPDLEFPLADEQKVTAQKEKMQFTWKPVKGAARYRFILERKSKQSKQRIPVFSKVTTKTGILSPALQKGLYYWKVSSIDKDNIEGSPSDERKFNLKIKKELTAPKLRAPVVK
jgi:hypothetical protein